MRIDSESGRPFIISMLSLPKLSSRRSFFLEPLFGPNLSTDILTHKGGYQIQLELPGVKRDDITIDVEKGSLNVTAVKKLVEQEGFKRVHAEREFGSVTRSFKLPPSVQLDKLEAILSEGVLTVSLPKKEEPKIEVKVK
jgi:HSP20 family molecular chaperone IbpA